MSLEGSFLWCIGTTKNETPLPLPFFIGRVIKVAHDNTRASWSEWSTPVGLSPPAGGCSAPLRNEHRLLLGLTLTEEPSPCGSHLVGGGKERRQLWLAKDGDLLSSLGLGASLLPHGPS